MRFHVLSSLRLVFKDLIRLRDFIVLRQPYCRFKLFCKVCVLLLKNKPWRSVYKKWIWTITRVVCLLHAVLQEKLRDVPEQRHAKWIMCSRIIISRYKWIDVARSCVRVQEDSLRQWGHSRLSKNWRCCFARNQRTTFSSKREKQGLAAKFLVTSRDRVCAAEDLASRGDSLFKRSLPITRASPHVAAEQTFPVSTKIKRNQNMALKGTTFKSSVYCAVHAWRTSCVHIIFPVCSARTPYMVACWS